MTTTAVIPVVGVESLNLRPGDADLLTSRFATAPRVFAVVGKRVKHYGNEAKGTVVLISRQTTEDVARRAFTNWKVCDSYNEITLVEIAKPE